MGLSAKAESNTLTLIQRFIKGAPEVGISPVPLVIGMSATPERFHRVLEGAQRITRPVEVKAEDVRESGLIKDRIILDIAEDDQPADWTLLRDAAQRAIQYAKEWKRYCKAQSIAPPVEPVLVVQVEDGTQNNADADRPIQGRRCARKGVRALRRGRVGPLLPAGRRHHGGRVQASAKSTPRRFRATRLCGWFSSKWPSPRAGTALAPR